MIVEDFVMLGRTVPEPSKKHGLVACSAGYSKEMRQIMRVYPLSPAMSVPRWSVCRLPLRRNSSDSRFESWRIKENEAPSIVSKVEKNTEFDFLTSISSDSIKILNDKRSSLGVIIPKISGYHFDGINPGEEFIADFFPEDKKIEMKPRLVFEDAHGKHSLQIRDWGGYEFLRKNPDKHHQLWSALKLDNNLYEHLLFVGNHNSHRNSWIIISIVSRKTTKQIDMLEGI
ncbi:hypothetical protein CCP4SC76_3680005 [Gammaproteobacteria bacterium]